MTALARLLAVSLAALTLSGAADAARAASVRRANAVNAKTAANERAAKRDAARNLRLAILPPGSRHIAKAPDNALGHRSPDWTPALIDRHAFWKVHKTFAAVAAFEKTHVPRGAKVDTPNCACGPTVGADFSFSFPALRRRVSSRQLSIEIAPLAHGWTGVRVDALDVWVVARDTDEKVPSGVRTIEIRRSDKALAHRITARATVGRIVRWFDALPVVQPVTYHCPMLRGPRVRLAFLGTGGTVLATADGLQIRGLSGPCNAVSFHVGGRAERPLVAGHFFGRVERVAR